MKLVVFDVDGTLVDSQADLMSAMGAGFAAVGRPLPERATVLSVIGLSLPLALGRLLPDLSPEDLERAVEAHRAAYAQRRARGEQGAAFYPHMREVVARLGGYDEILLGVATGNSRRGLEALKAAHGLERVFITEQVADDHPSKPHPSMLEAALSQTGLDARDAVMVGDTTYDLEMARAAGMAAIGVSWGYHPVAQLMQAGADVVLNDPRELEPFLRRFWGDECFE